MQTGLLQTLSQGVLYVLGALLLLYFVHLMAKADERAFRDDTRTMRFWMLIGSVILLVLAWRVSLPLLVIAIIIFFMASSRNASKVVSSRAHLESVVAQIPKYERKVPPPIITRAEYENSLEVSVNQRFARHGQTAISDSETRMNIGPVFTVYECGMYEDALQKFTDLVKKSPSTEAALWPYLEICDRVARLRLNDQDDEDDEDDENAAPAATLKDADMAKYTEDANYSDTHYKMQQWYRTRTLRWNWWTRLWTPSAPRYIRCKHCGQYKDTQMVSMLHPGDTCYACGRTYPLPSALWDSVPGQAYMFYRRSVPVGSDRAFYQAFVERFDVKEFNDDRFGGVLRFKLPERYTAWLDEKTFAEHNLSIAEQAVGESASAMTIETYHTGYVPFPDPS